jgi:hypothetical protein
MRFLLLAQFCADKPGEFEKVVVKGAFVEFKEVVELKVGVGVELIKAVNVYADEVEFVSYDIPHPLKNMMVIRFNTKKTPEAILTKAKKTIEDYCLLIE